MQRELFNHIFKENVRWGDCDQLGHVNNTTFLQYIESARVAYIYDVMGTELVVDSIEGWVIVDLSCAFRAQLKFPAKLEVCTRVSALGNSSAKMEAAIFIEGEESPVFTSTATVVWCNYKAGKSVRIPDAMRLAMENYDGALLAKT